MAKDGTQISAEAKPEIVAGVGLSVAISAAAMLLDRIEAAAFGHVWIEALVLAILIGAIVRTVWTPGATWQPGIRFSGKTLLEIAIVLLGLSVSGKTIGAAGGRLLFGIAGVVAVAICASFLIGRALGLPSKMALLVACGNSICGNSAIAAVAPIIDATSDDVAASIAFTAILGVLVVIGLPMIGFGLHMAALPFGAFAGLTVYAVPQVIAAAAPLGSVAVQIGMLAKLVRVLMLGPVCFLLSLLTTRLSAVEGARRPPVSQLVPWFVIGFLALMAIRSTGILPQAVIAPVGRLSTTLTIVSMAALGLGCDVRTVARAGIRVTAAATLSLILLGGIAWGLIHLLGLL